MREQMEAHRANPACIGCHQLMDPIGFALEQYDAIGRWRTTDGANVIDPTSTMYDGTRIAGPADLRNFLLGYSDQYVRTVTEKLMTYALGRGVEYYDMPVVRSIVQSAEADGYRWEALLVGVVQSEPFRSSRKGGAAAASSSTGSAAAATTASN
jgi:hypothetical protein